MTSTNASKSESERAPEANEEFQLSSGWVIVGVLAVLVGIGCGLVMSSATFFR